MAQPQGNPAVMSRTRKALLGLVTNYALTPLRIASQLIVVPVMLAGVGEETLGLWYLAAEVVAYLNLVESGNGQAALRYAAMRQAVEGVSGVSRVLSTLVVINMLIGVALFIIAMPLAPWLAQWYELDAVRTAEFIPFIVWVMGWVSFRFILRLFPMALRGFQEQAIADIASGVGIAVKLIVIVLSLQLDFGLLALIFGEYAASIVEMLIAYYYLHKRCPGMLINFRLACRKEFRSCFSYSSQLLLLSIPSLITTNSSSMIIAKLYGPLEVTVFNVTLVAARQASALLTSATPVILPGLCELYAVNDHLRIVDIFKRIMPPLLMMNLVFFFVVSILTESFVDIWVGPDKFGGTLLVCFFMLWSSLVGIIHPLLMFMRAEGNLKGLLCWAYVEAILVVLLSIYFGKLFGLAGIALALTISHLLATHHYLWRWAKRKLGYGITDIFKLTWEKAGIVTVVFSLIAVVLQLAFTGRSSFEAFLYGCGICLTVAFCLLWNFALEKSLRTTILEKVSAKFSGWMA